MAPAQAVGRQHGPNVKLPINTHWHFDHTDNNENFRVGAAILLCREHQETDVADARFARHALYALAASRLPTQTFVDKYTLRMNGERVEAGWIPPAHTDTDAYVHFTRVNALHMGDVYFNGVYPFIDASTGGSINARSPAPRSLKVSDKSTGDRARSRPGRGLRRADGLPRHARDGAGPRAETEGQRMDPADVTVPTADLDATRPP